jgi:WD40 repeat protein
MADENASLSPDGSRVVSTSGSVAVQVWDANTGADLVAIKGHDRLPQSVSFSRDGARIATAGSDGTARVWDAKTGAELLSLKGHTAGLFSASFNSDGSRVVTVSQDGTARVWDAEKGAEVPPMKGHTSAMLDASFYLDGSQVVTASADGMVRVWDTQTGAESRAWRVAKDLDIPSSLYRVAFSRDGARIATCTNQGTVKLWEVKTGVELLALRLSSGKIGEDAHSLALSQDGSRLITVIASTPKLNDRAGKPPATQSKVQAWDTKTGGEVLSFVVRDFTVDSVVLSLDGTRLLAKLTSRTTNGEVRIWNANTGDEIQTIKYPGNGDAPMGIAFSADERHIAMFYMDGAMSLLDSRSGTELLVLRNHSGWLSSMSFSPDGSRIITGGFDGKARV